MTIMRSNDDTSTPMLTIIVYRARFINTLFAWTVKNTPTLSDNQYTLQSNTLLIGNACWQFKYALLFIVGKTERKRSIESMFHQVDVVILWRKRKLLKIEISMNQGLFGSRYLTQFQSKYFQPLVKRFKVLEY